LRGDADRRVVLVASLPVDSTVAASVPVAPEPSSPGVVAPPPPPPPGERPSGSARIAGLVVGAVGLVSVGVGAIFGLQAISKRHDAEAACQPGSCGDNAYSLNSEGKRDAWIADFAIGAGAVGLAVGAYLVLSSSGGSTAPPAASTAPRVAVGPRGFALALPW
jgi:hypothetical protein